MKFDKRTRSCPILKLCRKKALFNVEAIFSSLFYASILFVCVVGFIIELREKFRGIVSLVFGLLLIAFLAYKFVGDIYSRIRGLKEVAEEIGYLTDEEYEGLLSEFEKAAPYSKSIYYFSRWLFSPKVPMLMEYTDITSFKTRTVCQKRTPVGYEAIVNSYGTSRIIKLSLKQENEFLRFVSELKERRHL